MRISNGAMHHKYYSAIFSPHNLLCSAAWPSRACHCVPVVGGVLAEAGTAVPGSTVCSASFSCGLGLYSAQPWRSSLSPSPSQLWCSSRWGTTAVATVATIVSVRKTSGLTTSRDTPCVWCVRVVTGDSECRRVDNGDAGSRQFR